MSRLSFFKHCTMDHQESQKATITLLEVSIELILKAWRSWELLSQLWQALSHLPVIYTYWNGSHQLSIKYADPLLLIILNLIGYDMIMAAIIGNAIHKNDPKSQRLTCYSPQPVDSERVSYVGRYHFFISNQWQGWSPLLFWVCNDGPPRIREATIELIEASIELILKAWKLMRIAREWELLSQYLWQALSHLP